MNTVITTGTFYTALLLGLSSCGKDENPESSQPATDSTWPPTLAVNTISDLPACADDNDKQLVYIKETKTFMTCSESEWSSLDIRGQDGKDGIDGEDGVDGQTTNTNTGSLNHVWTDLFTGQQWVYMTVGQTPYQYPNEVPCPDGWQHPTVALGLQAANRGLKVFMTDLNLGNYFWTSEHDPATGTTGIRINLTNIPISENISASTLHPIFCLQ